MLRRAPLLLAVLVTGCAVSHGVRPLKKGTGAITASMGGPLSKDLPTPVAFTVPITTVGYAHGVSDKSVLHGAVHPTGLAAFGVFAADVGFATQLVETNGAAPRVMLDGDLIFATGNNAEGDPPGGTRLFPNVEVVASWDLGKHAVYGGVNQLLQPFPEINYHVSPLLGTMLVAGRTDIQIEYMWLAPYANNELTAAEFVGPFGQGASSIKVGLGFRLGKDE